MENYWAPCSNHGQYEASEECDGGHWETHIVNENICYDYSDDSGGSPGGGDNNDDFGINYPIAYEGEEDLSNPSFMFAAQVNTFIRNLTTNNLAIKNIIQNNFWLTPVIIDFMRYNGGLTQANKDIVINALNNFIPVQSFYNPNATFVENYQLRYNAFIFLLHNPNNEEQNFVNEIINASVSQINQYGNTLESQNIVNDLINILTNGDNNANDDFNLPVEPSSLSFNYTNTGANWQEAAVKGIYFQIATISPQGISFTHIMDYPQPILFGCPRNLIIGNTNITSSIAASVSAQVLKVSMSETARKYGNKPVSDLIINLYFESRIKYNYSLYLPGGRVIIHPIEYDVTPTPYVSN